MSALLLLQAHGSMTGRELAKRLEVSERTIHRDMEALSVAGVPVFALRGAHGGWQLAEDWRTQVPALDEAELQALLMAQPRVVGDMRLAAERALSKLMAALPESLRTQAAFMQERLYVDTTTWHGTMEDLSMLPIVQEAVSLTRKLAFRYRKNREYVERVVDPLGLVAKGGTWYLVANTINGFRTYRVSRMDQARVLDMPGERPENFNLADHWRLSAAQFQEELNREFEATRRAMAAKVEAERRAIQEMEIAKEVQSRLFPQVLPQLRTADYGGVCIQARQVGGDYYDFLQMRPGRVAMVLADVAGKGISAALLMANLQANLRSQYATLAALKDCFQPALEDFHQMLGSVNRLFYENSGGSNYATLFFADYDDATQRLFFVNCGHLSALLLRGDDKVERLDSTCTVLGLFQDWNCVADECQLFPGDMLAFYTDGVTETFNSAGEEFGEHRLLEALRRHKELPLQDLLGAVVKEVQQFCPQEQHDDITLIVTRCKGDASLVTNQLSIFA
jgi:serine phosphatase RsbU (regulator of sigma subunit)/biotin operon repressor